MDVDLLSDILTEGPHILTGNLLQNLPDRSLTRNGENTPSNNLQDQATQRVDPDFTLSPGNCIQAGAIISKIEDIFELIADGILQQKQEVVIRLKPRRKPGNQNIPAVRSGHGREQIEVKFPSKSPQEAWKFSELCDRIITSPTHKSSRLAENPRAFP
jgi:meiotic recombination protein SPO11